MINHRKVTALLTLTAIAFAAYESKADASFNTHPLEEWATADVSIDHDAQIALDRARNKFNELDSSAVFLTHQGQVLLDWGETERKFRCHSMRKSLLFSVIGIHVELGLIDLDATMEDLGIDDIDPLSDTEKQATVLDLLKCRSGIYHPAAYEAQTMKDARPERGSHSPGTHYYYNNWDYNALVTIFEQETGKQFFETFRDTIAEPIGMKQFSLEDTEYHYEKELSKHPAYPFKLTAKALARYGTLILNNGKWGDRQITTPEWIAKETAAYSHDGGMDVGFHWRKPRYGILKDLGAYFTSGSRGHRIYIIQDLDMVFVHRVNTFEEGHEVRHYDVERLLKMILIGYPDLLDEKAIVRLKDETSSHESIAIDPTSYSKFLGDYARRIAKVTQNDKSSHIELFGGEYQKVRLEPIEGQPYAYRVPNGRVIFSVDEEAQTIGHTHHIENRESPHSRFAPKVAIAKGIQGEYVYSRYTISRADDKLHIQRDDREKRELIPLSATEFFVDYEDLRFEFVLGDDGVASKLIRHRERDINEATRIR